MVKDGIDVSTKTGLPATYKSQNCVWGIAATSSGSYFEASAKAKALELDIEVLSNNTPTRRHVSLSEERAVFEKLLSMLKKAGGLKYSEIYQTVTSEDENRRKKVRQYQAVDDIKYSSVEKLIAR